MNLRLIDSANLRPALGEFLRSSGKSLINPYHNLQHALRVAAAVDHDVNLWIRGRRRREFILAALYHDWGHPGCAGDDAKNVERAALKVLSLRGVVEGVKLKRVAMLIRSTQFPMDEREVRRLGDHQLLLRDADIWNQGDLTSMEIFQLNVGLATEFGVPLRKWIEGNIAFFTAAPYWTEYGEVQASKHRARFLGLYNDWLEVLPEPEGGSYDPLAAKRRPTTSWDH